MDSSSDHSSRSFAEGFGCCTQLEWEWRDGLGIYRTQGGVEEIDVEEEVNEGWFHQKESIEEDRGSVQKSARVAADLRPMSLMSLMYGGLFHVEIYERA